MPGGRRGARALAVQALYEADVAGHSATAVADRLRQSSGLSEENVILARELVGFVEKEKVELDRRIDGSALKFSTARMAAVDRNLLRVSLAETVLHPETPRAVVITECVELARLFGGDGSPGFVHGLLGALLR
jgi:N utilization substance protein B